ncbi:MAG: MATE family efflux transporter [Ruminococcaceae bacterium]|nr:MATE family efflux transporter [Oscillospiraceae bacterium]
MAKLESRKMGEQPVAKLLITMALPVMFSMLTQAFYNVVDSIYVSRVSEDCLAALSIAFPVQNMLIGLATGTAVGVGTLISRALGAGDNRRADKVAGVSIFLMFCCWALLATFGIFFAESFFNAQTDMESIRQSGTVYLRIVCIGSIFAYGEIGFNRMLQATSLTRLSMWGQLVGALTNILLDPFFIFGWCGLPAMGTAGAALATVIGQATGAAVAITLNLRKNKELTFRLKDIRPDWKIIGRIYRIGAPSILMIAVGSVMNFTMNRILMGFTSTAVAVFGTYGKLQSFAFMPVFGLNNAMVPIIGYNYGAGKKERIYQVLRWAVTYAAIIMFTILLIFQTIPHLLLAAFDASETMLSIGIPALRRISLCFVFAGFCVVAGSACQALDKSFASLLVSILRQVVVLLPAAWLLAQSGDVNMVWWAFPIAEIMSLLASAAFLWNAIRHMEKSLAVKTA